MGIASRARAVMTMAAIMPVLRPARVWGVAFGAFEGDVTRPPIPFGDDEVWEGWDAVFVTVLVAVLVPFWEDFRLVGFDDADDDVDGDESFFSSGDGLDPGLFPPDWRLYLFPILRFCWKMRSWRLTGH